MIFRLGQEIKDIKRFKQILTILFEEGFDVLIAKTKHKHHVAVSKRLTKKQEQAKKKSNPERLVTVLERLGPTYIKFGQMLSVRPDLVPGSYLKELEKLQDQVPAFTFKEAKEQLQQALGKNIMDAFASFEKKPIASASISQVHRSVLKNGKRVAVKIQRPRIRQTIQTDIEIMKYMAKTLEKHIPGLRPYHPQSIIDEFSRWTAQELDFRQEALHVKRFRRLFEHDKHVTAPKIYEQYTTETILVMEYIDGVHLHELPPQKRAVKQIIKRGFNAVLSQVFVHGFFHADPHPGNIIITKQNNIVFVDFGIVGHFSEALKNKCVDIFYAILSNDPEKLVDVLVSLSSTEIESRERLVVEVTDILDSLHDAPISQVKISTVLERIMQISMRFGMRFPMAFVLFGKTLMTLEGIALKYDPSFKVLETATPFMEQLVLQRYDPRARLKDLTKRIDKIKKYSEQIPEQAARVLNKIEKGNIRVDLEDTDIHTLSVEIDRSSNRIAYSLLAAAFLIVGALTLGFGTPLLVGIPFFSLINFLLAFTLFTILVISILTENTILK